MTFNKSAYAVIGAGFGDEGKGLVTDVLVRKYATNEVPIVARGNGGSQAGHTVVTPEGKRHVFSHIGAGAFNHAPTYLGSRFLVNPPMLKNESDSLCEYLGYHPSVFINPTAQVVTWMDVVINQLLETSRGTNRHGSCGAGINEAITRTKAGYSLSVETLMGARYDLIDTLRIIRDDWVPTRLAQLGLANHNIVESFHNVDLVKIADSYYDIMRKYADGRSPNMLRANEQPLIVEGAQGLMLDEHLGKFPHVTRSNTGLCSAMQVAKELNRSEITPIYVTRAYSTRHGNGPLANEGKYITDRKLVDKTNGNNEWQGSFRYAPLMIDELSRFIKADLERAQHLQEFLGVKINTPKLVVTCLDQLGEMVTINECGVLGKFPSKDLPMLLSEHLLNIDLLGTSHGETANTFKFA